LGFERAVVDDRSAARVVARARDVVRSVRVGLANIIMIP
jgi:hypothetical protein